MWLLKCEFEVLEFRVVGRVRDVEVAEVAWVRLRGSALATGRMIRV